MPLILHNTFGPENDALYQSRAGVLDEALAVRNACDRLGIAAEIIPVSGLKHLYNVLTKHAQDHLVVNLIEEFYDSPVDACFVPAICDTLGKRCSGNSSATLLLARNKIQTKALLKGAGLPCPEGITIYPAGHADFSRLKRGTYIVKPAFCDASEGITHDNVLSQPEEQTRARALIKSLHNEFGYPVIMEQFIPDREINVSVIERNGQPETLPLAEIDFSAFNGNRPKIVDYNAKWDTGSFEFNNTPRKIPAELPDEIARKISRLAIAAWDIMECRGYARIDFRLDNDLNPYIIEVNPNPDISPDAGFAAALNAAGIEYHEFVRLSIATAEKLSTGQKQPVS